MAADDLSNQPPPTPCWRVVRVTRVVEAVEGRVYLNADQAHAAAFGYRSRYPGQTFEVERA
jgi:hypothetical protein